jgi:hypothetical protein
MPRYGLGTASTTPKTAPPRGGALLERLIFLDGLGPKEWYAGSHLGKRRYYVAVFDRVAVADTPDWGNALYYCAVSGERWKTVFRLSKDEARRAGARRIFHDGDWRGRLKRVLGRT